MKKSNNKLEITSLIHGNCRYTDGPKIVNIVNDHFVNAGKQTQATISPILKDPLDYVKPCKSILVDIRTTETEVEKIVNRMKDKFSSGHDELSNHFVKQIFAAIRSPLTHVINMSLSQSVFPTSMKIAKVNALHKGGSTDKCDNLRPISLLPVFSKIIEKVVFYRTVSHMERNNILYFKQFGFRKQHSTGDAISTLIGEILNGWNNNFKCISVFIDLRKAFDTVDHELIIKKLQKLGISGSLLKWYAHYLSDRKQYSVIGTHSSTLSTINTGVPQGSLLGVLLFQILINDLKNSLKYSSAILYADDTTILLCGRNIKFILTKLQNDLDNLSMWLRSNKLALNTEKTKVMVFAREYYTNEICLTMNGTKIEQISDFKFLGFHVDDKLTCEKHCTVLYTKLLQMIFLMGKIRDLVPIGCLRMLYYAHFHSKLTYALSAWGGLISKKNFESLYKLQKRLIRIIFSSEYRAHTMPLFKRLNVLNLEDDITLHLLKMYHKIVYKTAPLPLRQLYERNNLGNIIVVKHKLKILNTSFLVAPISLWNKLPTEIKQNENLKSFAKLLKERMIKKY